MGTGTHVGAWKGLGYETWPRQGLILVSTLALMKLALLLLAFASPTLAPMPAQGSEAAQVAGPEVAQREADVHNYLAMRLRLLKRGAATEELKAEIVNQIDFATISPRSLDLLRRLLALCDRAIANHAKLSSQVAAIENAAKKADDKAAVGVGGALIGLASGGVTLPALLALLPELGDGDAIGAQKGQLLAQNAAEFGADISTMEFDLAVLRSQIQSGCDLPASAFVGPSDYDQFLTASNAKEEKDRIAGVAAALERSPRLQPAALYLAAHFYTRDDHASCTKFADRAIQTAPSILRRDTLRAQAYVYKAELARRLGDYKATIASADLGLEDDPANVSLLWLRGVGLAFTGKYADALPIFEKLVLLAPQSPDVHYNLACCQSVASKDAEAALNSLRAAMAYGFGDIAQAKSDADLALVREQRKVAFDNLVAVHLSFAMGWNLFDPDDLLVTNESSFPLRKLDLVIVTRGVSAATPPKEWTAEHKATIEELASGSQMRIPGVVNTTREAFRELRVRAEGPQGKFEAVRTLDELNGIAKPPR